MNFVVPVSHFYTPCRMGWLGRWDKRDAWDTVGQRTDVRFTRFIQYLYDCFRSFGGYKRILTGVPSCPTCPMWPELSTVSCRLTGKRWDTWTR